MITNCLQKDLQAELAELADALDSGSSAARLPGSSPGFRIDLYSSKHL